ncbi:hypothetical protein [Kiloniella litopenaei]|uniref:hypothetical protein n=1 Tax=Kiloniella litopenaei TaxID=1549748 RepID=UPI003BA92533
MRQRYLIHELAILVGSYFSKDPKDVALDFLSRWLKCDEKIFLNDARTYHYMEYLCGLTDEEKESLGVYETQKKQVKVGESRRDLFTISNSQSQSLDGTEHYYNPKEIGLNRISLINFLDKYGWGHESLGKMISNAFATNSLSHEFFVFIADNISETDLSEGQWTEYTRISMTLELAIRYCVEVYGVIPPEMRMKFSIEYTRDKKNGPKVNEEAAKEECYQAMKWLIANKLHNPRKGGRQECAELIQAFWDVDRDITSNS